jgi:tight adherence protein C
VVLTLIIAITLLGAAVALTLRAVAIPRIAAVSRVGEIKAYGFGGEVEVEVDERRTVVDRAASTIGQAVARHSQGFKEADVRHALMTAGLYTTSPNTFLGYRVLGTILVPAAILWSLTAAASPAGLVVVGGVIAVLTGWTLPMSIVNRKAKQRMEVVEQDLPELIDLLVVTVEAGLGFNGSLRVAASRFHGPLRDELRLTLQEQRLGLPINTALTNLLSRCETPSMRSFVRSVLQGETLGVSIGLIMRNLGVEMRKRRRQHAEERAQKAPVKMLFPLVFCIFPAILITLLYPAVKTFSDALG